MPINTALLFPLILFSIVSSFTPGPNNTMLMASGLNFGLRRTLPHILGVTLGYVFLILCLGFGLGAIFTAWPMAYTILKYVGSAYLLYLAWKIASADPHAPKISHRQKPLSFIQAAAFQWINVKGCVMGVGAISTYAGIAAYPYNILLMAGIFLFVCLGSTFTWAAFGITLQHLLKNPRHTRIFNIVMAILLVASIYPVFTE
jgi:threonine/homoserine/homoserine lactone efflux protein